MCGYHNSIRHFNGTEKELFVTGPTETQDGLVTRWSLWGGNGEEARGDVPFPHDDYDTSTRAQFDETLPAAEQAARAYLASLAEGVTPAADHEGDVPERGDNPFGLDADPEYLERLSDDEPPAEDDPVGDYVPTAEDRGDDIGYDDPPIRGFEHEAQDELLAEAARLTPHFDQAFTADTAAPDYVSPVSGLSNRDAVRAVRDLLTKQLIEWGDPDPTATPPGSRTTIIIIEGQAGDSPADALRTLKERLQGDAIAALKAYGYEPEPPRTRLTEEEAAALLDDAPVLDDESEPEPDLELGDPAAVQYGG